MKIKRKLLLVIGLTALLSWTCTENPLEPDIRGPNEVWNQNSQFIPQTLTISTGTTVTWTNRDNQIHTVDSGSEMNPTGLFNITLFERGKEDDSDTFAFSNAGTFNYYCGRHGETGTIIVN